MSFPLYTYNTVDVDECSSNATNDCDLNAICTNTEGSYVCRCIRGYEGDGRNCTGIYLSLVEKNCVNSQQFISSCGYRFFAFVLIWIFYLLAVISGCSPSCDPNAFCDEDGELPVCVCNPGFQGDGQNCTGQ